MKIWKLLKWSIWVCCFLYYVVFHEYLIMRSLKDNDGVHNIERFFITFSPIIILVILQLIEIFLRVNKKLE